MYNNPLGATPATYLGCALKPSDRDYIIFGVDEVRNNARYYSIYRVVWQRDGSKSLHRDHSFFWKDAPDWLRK